MKCCKYGCKSAEDDIVKTLTIEYERRDGGVNTVVIGWCKEHADEALLQNNPIIKDFSC